MLKEAKTLLGQGDYEAAITKSEEVKGAIGKVERGFPTWLIGIIVLVVLGGGGGFLIKKKGIKMPKLAVPKLKLPNLLKRKGKIETKAGAGLATPPMTRPTVTQPAKATIPEIKVQPKLVDYVKKQFAAGYTSITIKNKLIAAGYTEGVANAAIFAGKEGSQPTHLGTGAKVEERNITKPPAGKTSFKQPAKEPLPEIKVDKELIDYVKRQFDARYSSIGIKKMLIEHGYSEQEANAAIKAAKGELEIR